LFLSEVAPDELIVVHFSQEADTLAVLSLCRGKLLFCSNGTHLRLEQIADGKHQTRDLQVADLSQEVGLVLHPVFRSGEPSHPPAFRGGGVMARGEPVKMAPPLLLKDCELDERVAHHVWLARQAALYRVDGVAYYAIPILLMQRNTLHSAAILLRDLRNNLDI